MSDNLTFNHLLSLRSNDAEHQNNAVRITSFLWPELVKRSVQGYGSLLSPSDF